MRKRTFSLLVTIGLISSVFAVAGSHATAQTEVPATVQIEDPVEDANYLNDGTTFGLVPVGKDHTTPADVSGFADLLKVWYTNDATTISVHVQTQTKPPSSGAAYYTEVGSNFNDAGDPCVMFEYVVAAPSFQRESYATVTDVCAEADPVEGKLVVEEAADGSGIATVTVPRSANAAFAPGGILTAPQARVTNATGPFPDQVPEVGGSFLIYPVIDNTEPGTDYALADDDAGPPAKKKKKKGKGPPLPPPGCDQGKGKKKGCPQPPKGGVCAPYVPGDDGKDAATSIVTDAATEAKPIEVPIATELATPETVSSSFHNIQVDTAAAETGLYARFEFDTGQDYDIYLRDSGGKVVAQAAGFNPVPAGPFDGTGSGGHSEQDAEQIDGVNSADCSGYTLDIQAFLTEGGEYTLKLWLSAATYPAAAQRALYGAVMSLI